MIVRVYANVRAQINHIMQMSGLLPADGHQILLDELLGFHLNENISMLVAWGRG